MHFCCFLKIVEESAKHMLEKIPLPLPMEPVIEKYPVKYEESMNTVLIQEVSGCIISLIFCTVYSCTCRSFVTIASSMLFK